MKHTRVVAVGAPTFRQQVSLVLDASPEDVGYQPSATAARDFLAAGRADVIVLSPEVAETEVLDLAEFVGRSFPTTAVIVVRDYVTNGFLTLAMRAGIRDVVDISRGTQELGEALDRAVTWSANLRSTQPGDKPGHAERGTIISVFSSKGGTGKTMVATNVAAAISQHSKQDTALLDLDLGMGDTFCYFGKDPTHSVGELFSVAGSTDKDAVKDMGLKFNDHLWGYGSTPDPATDKLPGETVGRMMTTLRSTFPFTVVDVGANYSEQTLAAFDLSDMVCLVTGLDVVGVRHLSKTLETLVSIGVPADRFLIVLNRADSKVGLETKDVEKVLKIQVDSAIPSSRLVPSSLNTGKLIFLHDPKSGVSESIGALAKKIIGRVPAGATQEVFAEHKSGLLNRFLGGRDVTGRQAVQSTSTR
jgi:pilus assembly protein CpaE